MWRPTAPLAGALAFAPAGFASLLAAPAPACSSLLATQAPQAPTQSAQLFRRTTLPSQNSYRFRAERWTPYSTSSPKGTKPATPSPGATSSTPPQEPVEAPAVEDDALMEPAPPVPDCQPAAIPISDSNVSCQPQGTSPTTNEAQSPIQPSNHTSNDSSTSPQPMGAALNPEKPPTPPSDGLSLSTSATSNASSNCSLTSGVSTFNDPCAQIPSLSDLMQPLYCKVCDAKLNGRLQASAHYDGKSHHRRLRQYLEKAGRTSDLHKLKELHQQKKLEKKSAGGDKLEESFCKLCDVAFTSDVQAKQHYAGRNHQRRLRGEPPLPKGFYNPVTGKWQRQPPTGLPLKIATSAGAATTGVAAAATAALVTGPHGAHASALTPGHHPTVTSANLLGAAQSQAAALTAALFSSQTALQSLPFYCEACNVAFPNQQQMTAHLTSPVHKSRMNDAALLAPLLAAAAAAAAAARSGPGADAGGGLILPLGAPPPLLQFGHPLTAHQHPHFHHLHATTSMTAAAAPCGALPDL
ncbi:zinc finger protein 385C-like [Varroa jacobsoni]|nr:zinc finger protein 385C-like [Varroa jacobsoni]